MTSDNSRSDLEISELARRPWCPVPGAWRDSPAGWRGRRLSGAMRTGLPRPPSFTVRVRPVIRVIRCQVRQVVVHSFAMPRQMRLDAPGVLHLMRARGVGRTVLFRDHVDRADFIARLAGVRLDSAPQPCLRCGAHPARPLARGMRSLLAGNAGAFRRHRRTGEATAGIPRRRDPAWRRLRGIERGRGAAPPCVFPSLGARVGTRK